MDHSRFDGKKTYEYVFDYCSEKILSGELKLNDKIPTERELAEEMGVSRNSTAIRCSMKVCSKFLALPTLILFYHYGYTVWDYCNMRAAASFIQRPL